MNREILFRAKRKDNGEWVEGLLWKKKYSTDKLFISCFPDKDDNEEVFVIDPSTVCQYTGLKDKNGNKIFENDIIRRKTTTYIVGFDNGAFGTIDVGQTDVFAFCDNGYGIDTKEYEIIGNIIDNKDLIKE